MHSQKNSEYIKIYILCFMIFLVIVNLADKKEHLDEVALSNMSTMYNNGNLTATDITVTGKIKLQNADNTIVTLTNPGGTDLKLDAFHLQASGTINAIAGSINAGTEITAGTDITTSGKIKFKNADNTIVTLTNPGKTDLKLDAFHLLATGTINAGAGINGFFPIP